MPRQCKAPAIPSQFRPPYPEHLQHLPAQPLLDLIDEVERLDPLMRKAPELLRDRGLGEREFYRIRANGYLTLDMADRFCARLGVPLVRVYPEVSQINEMEGVA